MIRIFGIPYTVRADFTYEDITSQGTVTVSDQVIRLARDIGKEAQETTLLHEILEVVVARLGLKVEHEQIKGFEVALYDTLTANGVSLQPLMDKIDRRE